MCDQLCSECGLLLTRGWWWGCGNNYFKSISVTGNSHLASLLTVSLIYFYTPVVFCCFFFHNNNRSLDHSAMVYGILFVFVYLSGWWYKLVGKVFPWKRIKIKKKPALILSHIICTVSVKALDHEQRRGWEWVTCMQRAASQILLLRMVVCFGWIIDSFCFLYFNPGVELVDHNLVVGLGVYGSPSLEPKTFSLGLLLHPRGKYPWLKTMG